MKNLLPSLSWLFVMATFIDYLTQNWHTTPQAPIAVALMVVASIALGFFMGKSFHKERIEVLQKRIEWRDEDYRA